MSNQVSLFPDVLGTDIEKIVGEECERTKNADYERSISAIRSLHEGYGYIAEEYSNLAADNKRLKDNLGYFLNGLSGESGVIDNTLTEIYGIAQEAAKRAIGVAAITRRIMEEVRYDDLPPEAYGEPESDNDIEFEETESNMD